MNRGSNRIEAGQMDRGEHGAADRDSTTDQGSPTTPTPASLYRSGLQHLHAGRHLDAQLACQQALAIDTGHADSLHLMGLLLLQTQQYDHAVEWLSRAILQDPRTDYLSTLGIALKQMGRLDDALRVFDKAVQLKPDDAELWKQFGGVLVAVDRAADALVAFQRALQLNPSHWEAAYQSGILLHQLQRFDEALLQFNACDQLRPAHAPTLQMRARAPRARARSGRSLHLQQYGRCAALARQI
jgi:tetratricopeptide (TPR) repeat protein